jgi:hypothetical protein
MHIDWCPIRTKPTRQVFSKKNMWIKPWIRDKSKNMFEYIKQDVNVTRPFCKWCYVIYFIFGKIISWPWIGICPINMWNYLSQINNWSNFIGFYIFWCIWLCFSIYKNVTQKYIEKIGNILNIRFLDQFQFSTQQNYSTLNIIQRMRFKKRGQFFNNGWMSA